MKRLCCLLVGLIFSAEVAYGLAGIQLLYSLRVQKEGEFDREAHAVTISGSFSPLPLVPAGVGVTYTPWISYATRNNEESVTGKELGVELIGWIPMIPFVTPYAKVNYMVWGKQEITPKGGGSKIENKLSGVSGAVGVGCDMFPFTTFMVEAGYVRSKMGARVYGAGDSYYSYFPLSIGVKVGI